MNRDQPGAKKKKELLVGVLSDTHGSVHSRVGEILKKVDLIIHAGDFDNQRVYASLDKLAPMQAARGNMDQGQWANALPPYNLVEIGGALVFVIHDRARMDADPVSMGVTAVIFGHTHRVFQQVENNVLYLNPGSTHLPRQDTAGSMMLLRVARGRIEPETIYLT